MYDRKPQNSIKQISFNQKNKVAKYKQIMWMSPEPAWSTYNSPVYSRVFFFFFFWLNHALCMAHGF